MSETLAGIWALLAGAGLGAVFFGGLWWTVRKGVSSEQPALWFLGSLLVRTGITMGGFYLVGRGHWERLALCLLSFFVARLLATWRGRPRGRDRIRPAPEAGHAS